MIRLLNGIGLCLVSMVLFAGAACAQDRLVPAGTLLQCVVDESNFLSATAAGDPVLCHLRMMEEFGRPALPKGAVLGGRLEEEKGPCRFPGKGYVNITFDRVILRYGDLPLPAKVIQARGCKVTKTGDISRKGQAQRHGAWLMPLQPWKLVSLPMRGRATYEEQLELRIMHEILIPASLVYGPMKFDRPSDMGSAQQTAASNSEGKPASGLTMLVLKSDEVYAISSFYLDGTVLKFEDSSGSAGVVDANEIDWLRTGEMTSAARSSVVASAARPR